VEHKIGGTIRKLISGSITGKRVMIEVKHGCTCGNLKDLKKAKSYLDIAEKYKCIIYRFYDKLHSANAKALLEYLKALYYEKEENKKVLRIFIKGEEWKGG